MKKGFTLIEILIVVFIIGVLATLITFNLSSTRASARDARRKADLQVLSSAIDIYNQRGSFNYPARPTGVDTWWVSVNADEDSDPTRINFPGDSSGLKIALNTANTVFSGDDSAWLSGSLLAPGIIPRTPIDPINSNSYFYGYTTNSGASEYKLIARLENGGNDKDNGIEDGLLEIFSGGGKNLK